MATALATITAATGKMTAATVTLAKRIARTASLRIRPISINDDEEWFGSSSCRCCCSAT